MYRNPVLDVSGDPACARFGGRYHLYLPEQVRRDGVPVGGRVIGYTSHDLVHWTSIGEVYDNVDVTRGGQRTTGLWAPAVLAHDGKYYLYYAELMSNPADDAVGDKDIVVVESNDPGDFKGGDRTVLLDGEYAFIDPSPFKDPGTSHLSLYFKRRGASGTGSEIRVRPMAGPTEFSGPGTLVVDSESVPDADNTVEQPMAWRAGEVYYLLYSAGSGSGAGYHISYLTSDRPTGPFTQRGVLFRSDADLTGDVSKKVISPGSSSIVRDGAGRPWMVYRQKTTTEDTFADRCVCIDPVEFHPAAESMSGTPTKGVRRPGPTPLH